MPQSIPPLQTTHCTWSWICCVKKSKKCRLTNILFGSSYSSLYSIRQDLPFQYHSRQMPPMPPLRLFPKSRLRLPSFSEVPQRDRPTEYLTTRTFSESSRVSRSPKPVDVVSTLPCLVKPQNSSPELQPNLAERVPVAAYKVHHSNSLPHTIIHHLRQRGNSRVLRQLPTKKKKFQSR